MAFIPTDTYHSDKLFTVERSVIDDTVKVFFINTYFATFERNY